MRDFSTLIRKWYRQNARDLPWRRTNDPYAIWLSEIILQQTRVDQGMSYFLKFMDHYPSLKDLAMAEEQAVLNDWQGLGYYSRARNLHAAAKYVLNDLNGIFPTSYEDILKMKGVGDYTASAIASFAYQLPHAVVDGNVYRVLSRYLGIDTPIDSTKGKKEFKLAAEELLSKDDPGTHNQAIMELGALVCTPSNPKCEECPVHEGCFAYAKGKQTSFPVKEKKTKVRNRYFNYLVAIKGDQVLINKRNYKDIWQGLYDFPLIEKKDDSEVSVEELASYKFNSIDKDFKTKHILSHQRIFATFWVMKVDEYPSNLDSFILIKLSEMQDYPMPQLLIRYLESSKYFGGD